MAFWTGLSKLQLDQELKFMGANFDGGVILISISIEVRKPKVSTKKPAGRRFIFFDPKQKLSDSQETWHPGVAGACYDPRNIFFGGFRWIILNPHPIAAHY